MNRASKLLRILSLMAGVAIVTSPAEATVITSFVGGTSIAFPALNDYTAGPLRPSGANYTFDSTSNQSVFGATRRYGLGRNGAWTGATGPFIGLNTQGDSQYMTIVFDHALSSVLAFMNYSRSLYPNDVPDPSDVPTFSAYDAAGNLIDSAILTTVTPDADDAGQMLGFSESTADIKSIRFAGAFIVADRLQVNGVAELPTPTVPEPASLALIGIGAVAWTGTRRRPR